MNRKLILLRGLPGCGKTTLAEFLEKDLSDCVCIAADDYFYKDGVYEFDAEKLHSAHIYCKKQTEGYMEKYTETIVIHNTNTTGKEMKDYFDLAARYGYTVISLIVENRHGNHSVHSVPDETMEKMRNRFNVSL